jgi:hypothetical protein
MASDSVRVRQYGGDDQQPAEAMHAFERDAGKLAAEGFRVGTQSWRGGTLIVSYERTSNRRIQRLLVAGALVIAVIALALVLPKLILPSPHGTPATQGSTGSAQGSSGSWLEISHLGETVRFEGLRCELAQDRASYTANDNRNLHIYDPSGSAVKLLVPMFPWEANVLEGGGFSFHLEWNQAGSRRLSEGYSTTDSEGNRIGQTTIYPGAADGTLYGRSYAGQELHASFHCDRLFGE